MFTSMGRRVLALAALVVTVGAGSIAAARYDARENAIAGSGIRFVGPFYTTQQSFDSTNGGQVGGEVRIYIAADTLRIGDVVYESANNSANTSTTGTDHEKVLGVVVGGRSTGMDCSLLSADVGTIAALPNRPAVIMRRGRTYVRVDTVTADTVHAGERIKPSTLTKGRVKPASATLTATLNSGATPVTSSAANGAIITVAGDGFTKVFGTGVKLTVPGGLLLAEINAR